jgi:Tfp pilus assembly protein PilN
MQGVAGTEVAIQRIGFSGSSVSLSGTAVTDVAVLAFKDRLEASDLVENVALPIANIKAVTSGGFTFTISFSLTELES